MSAVSIESGRKPRQPWTEDRIRDLASTVDGLRPFREASLSAYTAARRVPGLIESLFGKESFRWSKESLIAEAGKYETRIEFQRGAIGAFKAAVRLGVIDSLFSYALDMSVWDETRVRSVALHCKTRSDLQRTYPSAYRYARTNKLLDTLYPESAKQFWDHDSVAEEALKYAGKADFGNGCVGAYEYALRHGMLDTLFDDKYQCWKTEDAVRAEAAKYRTKSEFRKGCTSAYGAASRMGILNHLGFKSGRYGYDSTKVGNIYVASIRLADSTDGVLFGITNRHPSKRYTLWEQEFMFDRRVYTTLNGLDAVKIETTLKRLFVDRKIESVQCPLAAKLGTSGEIIKGVSRSLVEIAMLDLSRDFGGFDDAADW